MRQKDRLGFWEGMVLKRHAFFNGIPSLSGSIPWIAIKTSAGASTGPESGDPFAMIIKVYRQTSVSSKIINWIKKRVQK